ncbi:dihydrofolate reductase family protein [Demequina sp. NBRC 110054]|uniref:dihydrofolate reductase family protein n=1 Tax=Demequina sp. NBRC 110054 TaxID=1570343 RepID=UPI000A00E12B|nr:dihydrofolate reductase family protein [Demequina sp. NBRC 110054]
MGTLCFTATVSLDGYAADASGGFQWSAPGEEVFDFHVERMAAVSAEVLGRRAHELMTYWLEDDPTWGDAEREFAVRWRDLDRVVASTTLTAEAVAPTGARLVSDLDLDALARIVADADGEVEIFGPTTAAPAISAGMVEHFRLFVVPRIVGGGLRALPDGASAALELVEQRVFEGGTTLLHYRSVASGAPR